MPMRYPFRKSSPFVVAGLFWVLTLINATVWGAPDDKRSGGPRMVSTMSEVNEILRFVDFEVLLRTDTEISKGIGLAEGSYLLPLANYLDFNFIGAGKSVRLDPEAIIRFILTRLAQGENIATIGLGGGGRIQTIRLSSYARERSPEKRPAGAGANPCRRFFSRRIRIPSGTGRQVSAVAGNQSGPPLFFHPIEF